MNEYSFEQMSDINLKQYITNHRQDKEAFHAYMQRLVHKPGTWHPYGDYTALESLIQEQQWDNEVG
jgi:hypothetical protein